jgi:TonB-dependent receptor
MNTGRTVTAIAVALLLTLMAGVSALATAQPAGTIRGQVVGPDGEPIAGAAVMLAQGGRGVLTDASGRFVIAGMAAGNHQVTVRQFGYRSETLTMAATAEQAEPHVVRLTLNPTVLPGIAVEGERGGQLRSIQEQRVSPTLLNVISADEIGVLPEQNVAEAVQRVSGLTIQTSRGEGRFVSIRGTAPRLNSVTLNGQTLASPGSSRATQLDMLPADMVNGVEVIKAVTPDMDANSVGGAINIKTLSAFDRREPFMFGSFEGMRHIQQVDYLDDKQPFEASVTTGRRFGRNETFGFVLGGNISRRDFGVSVLDPDGWDITDEGYVFPEEIELQVEDNERMKLGFTGALDWRPSERTSLSLRGLFTRTREITSNSEYEFGFEGDLLNATPNGGRYTEGSAELDLSERNETSTLGAFSLAGSHRLLPALNWSFSGTFTTGRRHVVAPDATFETVDEARLSNTFDVSRYFFSITPDDPDFIRDPATYPLRSMSFNDNRDRENTGALATDLRLDTRLGSAPAFLKLGVKTTIRDKTIDETSDRFLGAGNTTLAQFAIDRTYTVQGGYSNFVHGNTSEYADFARANKGNTQVMTPDDYSTLYESWKDDRDTREAIYAGFFMGNIQLGGLSVTGGLRMERTALAATRREVLRETQQRTVTIRNPTTAEESYTHWLPALLMRLDATSNLVLRAAWTNTIGRPDYDEFAMPQSLSYRLTRGRTDLYDGTFVMGNLGLEPYESANLDATAEYYFSSGGMLGVAGFLKQIDNPIFEWSITEHNTTWDGLSFNQLVFTQDRNADEGTLRGVEFSWLQPLVFLPKPLDGLGIHLNFALIDSDVTIPGREDEDLPFFEQSSRIINLVPYFQRGPVELRLAMSYRNEYLTEVGEESFGDRYIDSRTTLDASGQYQLPGNRMELYVQLRNLTNEPEVGYQGKRSRYDLHVLTGRTISLGLRARY